MGIGFKLLAIAAFGLAIGFSSLYPGSASAAPYNNACGAGYKTIDRMDFGDAGTVWLTYNPRNGYNCVVTIKNHPGVRGTMSAMIRVSKPGLPNSFVEDKGEYTKYAGPVYVFARGSCIDWGGIIGSWADVKSNTHCG